MKINREYKYFVVDTCDWLIVSGWEYKEDALENLDDLLEGMSTAVTGDYKIYTARYLNSKDINPFNPDNWISNDYYDKKDNDYDCGVCEDTGKKESFDLMSMKESIEDCPDCKTKQYKVTMKEIKYCYYIVNAKSEDDIRDNMNPEIDGEHIYTKPKSDEIIGVELYTDNDVLTEEDAQGTINNPLDTEEVRKLKMQLDWFNSFVDAIQTWDHKLYNNACKYADEVEEGCI